MTKLELSDAFMGCGWVVIWSTLEEIAWCKTLIIRERCHCRQEMITNASRRPGEAIDPSASSVPLTGPINAPWRRVAVLGGRRAVDGSDPHWQRVTLLPSVSPLVAVLVQVVTTIIQIGSTVSQKVDGVVTSVVDAAVPGPLLPGSADKNQETGAQNLRSAWISPRKTCHQTMPKGP